MLIGVRNWYTELGVTPVHTGTDPGTAFHLDRLAKPFAGYISRSTRRGSSLAYGAAGLSVLWPRSVPVRLVAVLGVRKFINGIRFRWRLYQGGPGGTLMATNVSINNNLDTVEGLANNIIVDLGATYVGDYLHLEWYNPAALVAFDFCGLWASDALSLAADRMTFELLNDQVVQYAPDGADYTIDRRVWRRIGYSGVIDSAVLNPLNGGDTTDSFAEFFAAAGKTFPVIFHRHNQPVMPLQFAVHGTLADGSGIQHVSGPISRVTVNVEEF